MDQHSDVVLDGPRRGLATQDEDAVWRLLQESDEEFIPPLSHRESTIQQTLEPTSGAGTGSSGEGGPRQYFEELMDQEFLLAREQAGSTVRGFLSFRRGHRLPVPAPDGEHLYVSTVIVAREFRRHGITRAMYQRLLVEAERTGQAVATRTWSTNCGHLRLLEELGIDEVLRLPDHRGLGIDTLYLAQDSPHFTDQHSPCQHSTEGMGRPG